MISSQNFAFTLFTGASLLPNMWFSVSFLMSSEDILKFSTNKIVETIQVENKFRHSVRWLALETVSHPKMGFKIFNMFPLSHKFYSTFLAVSFTHFITLIQYEMSV